MQFGARISVLKWRISRVPFIAYLCVIPMCWTVFQATNGTLHDYGSINGWAWSGAALTLLFMPVPLSMRLRDAGRSPFWPIPILFVLFYVAVQFLGAMASVSGAPGSNISEPSLMDKVISGVVMVSLALLALLTFYGIVAPSKNSVNSTEVPS